VVRASKPSVYDGSRARNSTCWRLPTPSAAPGSSSTTRAIYFHQLGQRSTWKTSSHTRSIGALIRQVVT
jgi:hypothetical protein